MNPGTLEFLDGYDRWYKSQPPVRISEKMLQAIKVKQIKRLIEVLEEIKEAR